MKTDAVVVVIPLYKSELEQNEIVSILQCFAVFRDYIICCACPRGLDISFLLAIAARHQTELMVEEYEPAYFENLAGYNRLMLSASFYERFKRFEYILIYQTDSFVFRDELLAWCAKKYDFIGAPWIDINIKGWLDIPQLYPTGIRRFHSLFGYRLLKRVGNGGLSLRNTKAFLENLTFFKKAASSWKANEDSFFSHYIGALNPFFKIPKLEEALQFSFDAFPERAFVLNHDQIPFGCHAWFRNKESFYKNNISFWKPHIELAIGRISEVTQC